MKHSIVLFLICTAISLGAQERKQTVSTHIENYRFLEASTLIDSILTEAYIRLDTLADKQETALVLSQQKEWVLLNTNCLKKLYRYDAAIKTLTKWNEYYLSLTDRIDNKIISELAECYSLSGKQEEALSLYIFLTVSNPGNIYYALQKGLILYKLEDYQGAVSVGKSLLERDSAYSAVISLVGNSFNKMGLIDSAMVCYDKLLRINPMDVGTINKKANILFVKNKPEEVVNLTGDYIEKDTTNLTVNSICGLALHLCKKYHESLDVFFRQQRLGDDSYATNYYIGLNYFLADNKYKAEQYFERAYQLDPSDVNLIYYYASSKVWQYNFVEGKALFDKALNMMKPDSLMMHKIYTGYAIGYYRKADYKNALKYYKLSFEQKPDFISALKTIGYCYEAVKDYNKALEYYEKYRAVVPKEAVKEVEWVDGKIIDMKGEIFMEQ